MLDSFPADVGEGGSLWKTDEKSDVYDMELVKVYLNTMKSARERDDLTSFGLCLRTVLHRNFAGIDRLLHLRFARVGTKNLVQEFNNEIIAAIKHIANTPDDERATDMLKVLKESYRSLGRTALCLSGGCVGHVSFRRAPDALERRLVSAGHLRYEWRIDRGGLSELPCSRRNLREYTT